MSLERKKEREKCEFKMALRHLFCCCSNLSNNYIITFIIWRRVFYWELNHSQIPYATSSGTRVAYFPYFTFVSVVRSMTSQFPPFAFVELVSRVAFVV